MSVSRKILVLPGDGIGPEVVGQVRRVIDWLGRTRGLGFELEERLIGGCAIDAEGAPLSDQTLAVAKEADAVLLGAVGGPQWDGVAFAIRPEAGLLRVRKELDLFANLRPAKVLDALADASPLKPELVQGLDLLFVRELTGGLYFGTPRGIDERPDGQREGYNTQRYATAEIHRVARVAFELAQKRQNRVCSVDKANVLETGRLWREEVTRLRDEEFPDVALSHMLVDNCAMQLVRNPKQFDVLVTDNMFGDILSDEASMLTGSLGMLPSASLGEADATGKRKALYEPIHGSAPDIAGQDLANPLATLLSFAMMLRFSFDLATEAALIETAAESVLKAGLRTGDIMQPGMTRVSTTGMGDAILQALDRAVA